jgi:hypothetical protein
MISVNSDLSEKKIEAQILIDLISEISTQKKSVQKASILKSAQILLLYNMIELRNPFFLDSESGFEWTLNPVFSGQCFLQFLPAV